MERFLARISDELLIEDYKTRQKISGLTLKQDILKAISILAPYNTIVMAEHNSYHWVVVLCACMCSGKTLHILDKSADLRKMCNTIAPDLLLTCDSDSLMSLPTLSAQTLLSQETATQEQSHVSSFQEGCICLYTTGTAQKSRSIVFQGMQAADTAYLQAQLLGLEKLHSIAILPPFSHAYGLSAVLSALQCVSYIAILRDSLSLFQFLRSENVQGMFVQPAVLQIAATHPAVLEKLGHMHLVACAGAKLEPSVHARFQEQSIPVVNIYGSTETGMCFIGATAVGGIPGHFFLSECMQLQLSKEGELLVRGSNIGRRGDATLLDPLGWYHTGDLAEHNADGSFSIIGRKGDVVVLNSGYKINIEQLEATIAQITAVADCQVLVQTAMGVDQLVLVVQGPLEMPLPALNRQLSYYEQIARVKQVGVIKKKRGKKIRMTKDRIMQEMGQIISQIAPEKNDWANISDQASFFHAMGFNSLASLQFMLSMEEKLGTTIDILEFDLGFTLDQLIAFFIEQVVAAKEDPQL